LIASRRSRLGDFEVNIAWILLKVSNGSHYSPVI
jgi:hypothetical protein